MGAAIECCTCVRLRMLCGPSKCNECAPMCRSPTERPPTVVLVNLHCSQIERASLGDNCNKWQVTDTANPARRMQDRAVDTATRRQVIK
jgi:hypothetical protein